ncbi:MAG: glycosyltransferase family 2 protein [Ignavibacteriaceae bacterium]|nr:glycosyltransferase family 2 protein [Ignavibacteriaceae bacterium]
MNNYFLHTFNSMNKPEISVVTAVYNRESYISRAVKSLLKQTFTPWELIAINDGSTDESLKILTGFQNNYENIKVVTQNHKNSSESKNTGIKLSQGKYITFLDSDDEFLPSHLETRYNYMISHPEIDLLHGGVTIIGDSFVADRNDPNKMITLYNCVIGGTFFGKRKVFQTLGGFNDITYGEDAEFLERAQKIFKVKKVIYPTYIYHRETPDSITNKLLL